MRQQHIATIGLAGGMWATPAGAASTVTAGELAGYAASAFASAITSGYRAAPALMLGLAMLLAVPVIALSVRLSMWWQRRRFVRAAARMPVPAADDEPAPVIQAHAVLEVIWPTAGRVEIVHDMLRIGREADNDIRLSSGKVHRYHAAIYRQDAGTYCIADLVGSAGNGVRVNGERCEEAQLEDGDLIELGSGRLRFHAGLV